MNLKRLTNGFVRGRVKDSAIVYVIELYADGEKQYTHETFYSKQEAIEAANEDVREYRGYGGVVKADVVKINADYSVIGEGYHGKRTVVYTVDNNMKVLSDSRRVKDAIEGDYDFYSHEMSSDDNRNAGENRRLQVLEDWYNSFTDKEMVAYEDLFDVAEDHSWNIDLYFDEIKGQEDRGVVEQILSSYKKFDGIPMNEVRLVIALPHKGWDAAFGGDDYLKLLFVRTKGSESASPKVLVSPLDAVEIFNMFTYKGGTYRYNENIDLFAEDVEVRKNVSDSRRVKDSLDEDNEYLLEHIGDLLEEGYRSGYDPQWDIDITVDGQDISEFNDDDRDLIYQDIAYVVKDGYDNYQGIETELSDGSIVYVDFVLNY